MTKTRTSVTNVKLELFKVGNSSATPDAEIPGKHLRSATVNLRIQDKKDTGTFTINNYDGRYAGVVEAGDRFQLVMTSSGTGAYGEGVYGNGPYGGGSETWTGIVRNIEYSSEGARRSTLTVETSDYPFSILSWRLVYDAFEQRQTSGAQSAILDTLLREKAPEIDRSLIEPITAVEDVFSSGTTLLDVCIDLARRADALMYSVGTSLAFKPRESVESQFTATPSDFSEPSVSINDNHVVNDVRVDGGTDYDIDDEQLTRDGRERVTETNRVTTRIDTRKATLDRILLWTPANGEHTSEYDNIMIRLQKDEGGSPINVGETKSDITSKQLDGEFLEDGGWTTFLLPKHTLPEPQPWLIIESSGSDGQVIGTDSVTGDPAYQAYYQFPISVKLADANSIDSHIRREAKIKNDNLSTFPAARAVGDAKLAHSSEPRREVKFLGESDRLLALAPGDVVTLDMPQYDAVGDFIISARDDEMTNENSIIMKTMFTLQEAATL